MAILDGKTVKPEEIEPAKHKFIGTFRKPTPPVAGNGFILCPCGEVLQIRGEEFNHWQQGHFDMPQYVTIKE